MLARVACAPRQDATGLPLHAISCIIPADFSPLLGRPGVELLYRTQADRKGVVTFQETKARPDGLTSDESSIEQGKTSVVDATRPLNKWPASAACLVVGVRSINQLVNTNQSFCLLLLPPYKN